MIQIVHKPESKIFHLTLIRHAKSSWKQHGLSDHQRPLAKRGKRDIPKMIETNISFLKQIDCFYSSSAVRARSIMDAIANSITLSDQQINISDSFYTFDSATLIEQIKRFPSDQFSAAVVGHNPAITDTLNQITGLNIQNMPTTGIARIQLNMNSWQELSYAPGKLIYFDCPKNNY